MNGNVPGLSLYVWSGWAGCCARWFFVCVAGGPDHVFVSLL